MFAGLVVATRKTAPKAGVGWLLPPNSSGVPSRRQEDGSVHAPKRNQLDGVPVFAEGAEYALVGPGQPLVGLVHQAARGGGGVGRDFGARAALPALRAVDVQFGDVNGQIQLRDFGHGPVHLIKDAGGAMNMAGQLGALSTRVAFG